MQFKLNTSQECITQFNLQSIFIDYSMSFCKKNKNINTIYRFLITINILNSFNRNFTI